MGKGKKALQLVALEIWGKSIHPIPVIHLPFQNLKISEKSYCLNMIQNSLVLQVINIFKTAFGLVGAFPQFFSQLCGSMSFSSIISRH